MGAGSASTANMLEKSADADTPPRLLGVALPFPEGAPCSSRVGLPRTYLGAPVGVLVVPCVEVLGCRPPFGRLPSDDLG